MKINAEPSDFAKWISEFFRAEFTETDESYIFEMKRFGDDVKSRLEKNRLTEALAELKSLEVLDDTKIWGNRSYEVLIRDESPFPSMRMRVRNEPLDVADVDNGLTYTLSYPSDAYVLFLLSVAGKRV